MGKQQPSEKQRYQANQIAGSYSRKKERERVRVKERKKKENDTIKFICLLALVCVWLSASMVSLCTLSKMFRRQVHIQFWMWTWTIFSLSTV